MKLHFEFNVRKDETKCEDCQLKKATEDYKGKKLCKECHEKEVEEEEQEELEDFIYFFSDQF